MESNAGYIKKTWEMLNGLLSKNASCRKANEKELMSWRRDQPERFLEGMIDVLDFKESGHEKILALVLLKQSFKNTETGEWKQVNLETQRFVKSRLLMGLAKDFEREVVNQLTETIAVLADVLLTDHLEDWDEILQFIHKTLEKSIEDSKYSYVILRLLIGSEALFYRTLATSKESLISFLLSCLSSADHDLNQSAIKIMPVFINSFPQTQVPYLTPGFSELISSTSPHSLDVLITQLSALSQSAPLYFSHHLPLCFEFVFSIPSSNPDTKLVSLSILTSLASQFSAFLQNNPSCLKTLCEQFFTIISSVDLSEDSDWEDPPEGFVDEHEVPDCSTQARTELLDILKGVNSKDTAVFIIDIIKSSLGGKRWQNIYAALMVMFDAEEVIERQVLVEMARGIEEYMKSNKARIRVAAFKCYGRIYSADLVEGVEDITQGLCDVVPRVRAAAVEAFESIIRNAGTTTRRIFAAEAIGALRSGLSCSQPSFVIERTLDVIDLIIYVLPTSILCELKPILFGIIKNKDLETQKRVKGKAVECLSTLFIHINDKNAATELTCILKTLENCIVEEDDPLKCYLLSSWQKLAYWSKQDLSNDMQSLLSTLIDSLHSQSGLNLTLSPNVTYPDYINHLSLQALHGLSSIISVLKSLYAPYTKRTASLLLDLFTRSSSNEMRDVCCHTLSLLPSTLTDPSLQISLSKVLLSSLWQAVSSSPSSSLLYSINTITESTPSPFISHHEFSITTHNLISLLSEPISLSLTSPISALISTLIKTHQSQSLPLLQSLSISIFPGYLSENSLPSHRILVIYAIIDAFEYLAKVLQHEVVYWYAEVIMKSCWAIDDDERQAAVFALGVLAAKVDEVVFEPFAPRVIHVLRGVIGSFSLVVLKSDAYIRDNAVSALGKVIWYQGSLEGELVEYWISLLPISSDEEEAKVAHEILVDVCFRYWDELFVGREERIIWIFKVFAGVIESQRFSEKAQSKLKRLVDLLTELKFNFEVVSIALTAMEKQKFSSILSGI